MLTFFHVDFMGKSNGGSLAFARIEKDLAFAPTLDTLYEQQVWGRNTSKAKSVTYNIDENFFYVILQHDELDPKDLKSHAEMYRRSGWTISPWPISLKDPLSPPGT